MTTSLSKTCILDAVNNTNVEAKAFFSTCQTRFHRMTVFNTTRQWSLMGIRPLMEAASMAMAMATLTAIQSALRAERMALMDTKSEPWKVAAQRKMRIITKTSLSRSAGWDSGCQKEYAVMQHCMISL